MKHKLEDLIAKVCEVVLVIWRELPCRTDVTFYIGVNGIYLKTSIDGNQSILTTKLITHINITIEQNIR